MYSGWGIFLGTDELVVKLHQGAKQLARLPQAWA
jgi:hypothetical protein